MTVTVTVRVGMAASLNKYPVTVASVWEQLLCAWISSSHVTVTVKVTVTGYLFQQRILRKMNVSLAGGAGVLGKRGPLLELLGNL